MGAPLRGPGITTEQARSAIVSIAPALEIIERRIGPPPDMALNLVDNVSQKAFVLGTAIPLGDRDLRTVWVEAMSNGAMLGRASGSEVLGDPVASIAWLANAIAPFGRQLEAGDRVMSGSFTPPLDISGGAVVQADFGPMGVVRATFR